MILVKVLISVGIVHIGILGANADCSTVFQNIPTFASCTYRCHCQNDGQCNEDTGECPQACDNGWMGPACQYRNVVKGYTDVGHVVNTGTASQYAIKAIDGDINTCSRTDPSLNPEEVYNYWRIQLGREYLVAGLLIHVPENDLNQLRGFRVEYGPTATDFLYVCYEHPDIPASSRMEISCSGIHLMKHIRIIQSKPNTAMGLCEVAIFSGREVAFKRATDFSTNLNSVVYQSSSVVDGKVMSSSSSGAFQATCFATGEEAHPSWTVSFGTHYLIQDVYLYGRLSCCLAQMQGFYVETDAGINTWTELHRDIPSGANAAAYHPRETALNQTTSSSQLRISKDFDHPGGILSICEIHTFAECPINSCGWDCSDICHCLTSQTGTHKIAGTCPFGCQDRWTGVGNKCDNECTENEWGVSCTAVCGHCNTPPCDITTGHCLDGCSGPWEPPLCVEACTDGTYGQNCTLNCGNCTNGTACNITTGHCTAGCEAGWKPPFCSKECDKGTYGQNCTETCGTCYQNEQCHHTTGVCENGCNPGYQNDTCKQECDNSTYGQNCTETCGSCYQNEQCHHITGVCENGCNPGYKGDTCKQECDNGTYGQNCTETCGSCYQNEQCHHITGVCENGCNPGYQNDTCKQECDNSTYGQNCTETCGSCYQNEQCHHITGVCVNGCNPGFKSDTCKQECDNGTYGQNCTESCGNCYQNEQCHHITGKCENGCITGYKTDHCKQVCGYDEYGFNCNETCGQCTDMEKCNKESGTCESGCQPGYDGKLCKADCESGKYGQDCSYECGKCFNETSCHHINGSCIDGCRGGFEGPICAEALSADDSTTQTTQNIAGMIGGIAAGLVVVVAVAVIGVLLFRRRLAGSKNHKEGSRRSQYKNKGFDGANEHSSNSDSERHVYKNVGQSDTRARCSVGRSIDEEDIDVGQEEVVYGNMNTAKTVPRFIIVDKLRTEAHLIKRYPSDMHKEFLTLPTGLQYPTMEALKAENKSRNRYKSMYPYDACRVKLPTTSGSDYINASYIDGFVIPRKYIAAMGAMEATAVDVWTMIWTENISVIVMLTKCIEQGKRKCFQYWFDRVGSFGDFQIELIDVDNYADFLVRKLNCTQLSSKKSRIVLQYHFTAWPDKDVPDTPLSVVQFWNKVRTSTEANQTPWMVHCSAGVGRTGTFIALDYLYDQGLSEGKVSVNGCVETLRQQRVTMVQTKEQYVYVYLAVCEALTAIGHACTTDNYPRTYSKANIGSAVQTLNREFSAICQETESDMSSNIHDDNDKQSSCLTENQNKSRNIDIAPADRFRPRLGLLTGDGFNDFINAVYIPTFRQENQLIMTQYPLPNTVVDFLRLVWEFNIDTVVLLEASVDTKGSYWPVQGYVSSLGPFSAELVSERTESTYTRRTIKYSLAGHESASKEIKQYQFTSWLNNHELPPDTGCLLRFMEDIQSHGTNPPFIVQCLDGASRSGLFTVLSCVLDRLRTDNEVAIAETVRTVRLRRPQAITGVEQYRYCYSVVQDYLESFDVYVNAM